MLFNSLEFIVFFPFVVAIFYIIPFRYRWFFLLLTSYYYYIPWKFNYIYLLFLMTLAGYISGILIEKVFNIRLKKIVLSVSILFNLGLLFIFKYLGFFFENLEILFKNIGTTSSLSALKLILPIGISYYTFQLISYSLDIYNGKIKAERHFGIFAVYISFFPKILSGPIERAGEFIPQLHIEKDFSYESVINGTKRFIYGFFKKVVIADGIEYYFNIIFSNPTDFHGITLILSVIFYSFEIYADFSGYTDMALGAAGILNIKLTDNFKQPYFSKSISEFWSKWHITLSKWLRDYLFLPLSYYFARKFMHMSRIKIKPDKWSYIISILITMTICGFWHGAKWTFVIWGLLHGFYLLFGFITRKKRKKIIKILKLPKPIQNLLSILFTFFLVSFAWIFFKSNDINDAIITLNNCFIWDNSLSFFKINYEFILLLLSLLTMLVIEYVQAFTYNNKNEAPIESLLKLPLIIVLLLIIILIGKFGQLNFLYFKF
jgi:alginate O-acetyltransferase complex protein AlgI